MRSETISGCLTISSTVSWPMMPRRWPSITSRIRPSRSWSVLVRNCSAAVKIDSRIRLHLDLRDRFDRHRDALLGVEILLRRHVERHQFQRQLAADLHHGQHHRAVPLHHARPAQAVHDECFVRPRFAIEPGHSAHQEQNDHHSQPDKDPNLNDQSEIH